MVDRSRGTQRRSQKHNHPRDSQEGGFSDRLNPTAWVRALRCNSVYIMRYRSMRIPVSIRTSYNKAEIRALVDSGATDNFMHPNFTKRMGLGLQKLPNPKKLYNVDNTTNKAGEITHFMMLLVETHGERRDMWFLITDIGKEDILFGYPWLANFEPQFSWKYATINEKEMLIILRSINPKKERPKMTQATIDRIQEE